MARRLFLAVLVLAACCTLLTLPVRPTNAGDAPWDITITPAQPRVGDSIEVLAVAYVSGGIPEFRIALDDESGAGLRLDSPRSVGNIFLPSGSAWKLTALQPGDYRFHVWVSYETVRCYDPPDNCAFVMEFASSPTSTITVLPRTGDADCDGSITSVDAALVLQSNAGLAAAVPCSDADPNGDGGWTAIDATLILQVEAGLFSF